MGRRLFSQPCIIIVSAYSTGSLIAQEFKKNGFLCIHISTSKEFSIPFLKKTFRPSDFIKNILIRDGDLLINVLQQCSGYSIKYVIAGSESGTELANRIAQYFNVLRNDYEFCQARRNKFNMVEAVRNARLNVPKQICTSNIDNLIHWYGSQAFSKVVVKPLASACSDGVTVCYSAEEIRFQAQQILGSNNLYNEKNEAVLIQEYIEGTEYIINTVSLGDKHRVIDIWCGKPKDRNKISNDLYADLVLPEEDNYILLSFYVKKVLKALGIKFGASHIEVKIFENQPYLIEVGARLPGRVNFSALDDIFSTNQLEQLIHSCIFPTRFLDSYFNTFPKYYARYIYLESPLEGKVLNKPMYSLFDDLDSLHSVNLVNVDTMLYRTNKKKKRHRPGFAYLIASTKKQIEEDYKKFKKLEIQLYKQMLGIKEIKCP